MIPPELNSVAPVCTDTGPFVALSSTPAGPVRVREPPVCPLPAAIFTLPASFPLPAAICTEPACVALLPTAIEISPDTVWELPVENAKAPEVPVRALPVVTETEPEVAPDALATRTSPLDE